VAGSVHARGQLAAAAGPGGGLRGAEAAGIGRRKRLNGSLPFPWFRPVWPPPSAGPRARRQSKGPSGRRTPNTLRALCPSHQPTPSHRNSLRYTFKMPALLFKSSALASRPASRICSRRAVVVRVRRARRQLLLRSPIGRRLAHARSPRRPRRPRRRPPRPPRRPPPPPSRPPSGEGPRGATWRCRTLAAAPLRAPARRAAA
jgi:hypothetical protein